MLIPWTVALSHQVVPYWNDAAHYANSARLLFANQVRLRDVMLFAESELLVQGDFHGPAYLFLHWPMAVGEAVGLSPVASSVIAYVGIVALKILTLYFMMRAISRLLGPRRAAIVMGLLLLFPYTRYMLVGTHRDWFLIYSSVLISWIFAQHPRSVHPGLTLLAALVFAQSHILSVLALPSIAYILGSRRFDKQNVRHIHIPFVLGLTLGYGPLLLRAVSGRLAGSASLEALPDVAGEALEQFDRARLEIIRLAGVGEITVPPLPALATAVLVSGMLLGLLALRGDLGRDVRRLVVSGLAYQALIIGGFFGLLDRLLWAIGLEMSWFSLQKLLSSNDRYWLLAVLISIGQIAISLIYADSKLGTALIHQAFQTFMRRRACLRRIPVGRITGGALVMVAIVTVASQAAIIVLFDRPPAWMQDAFFPGAAVTPLSDYLAFAQRTLVPTAPVLAVGLLALLVLVIAVQVSRSTDSNYGVPRDGSIVATTAWRDGILYGLATVAMFVALNPLEVYGHGRTQPILAEIEYWESTLEALEWDEGCFIAASSSTPRFFLDRPELPVVYLEAADLHFLWADGLETPSGTQIERLPCAVFPNQIALLTPQTTNWRQIYTQRVDGPTHLLFVNPRLVSQIQ